MNDDNWRSLATSWEFSPWVLSWLMLLSSVYVCGWVRLQKKNSGPRTRFGLPQLACFLVGLLVIFMAIQSPLDAMAAFSLQAHMVQHLLLIIIAPLLLLWGRPMVPIISGLPRSFRDNWFTPFAKWPPLRAFLARLFHPVTTWLLFVISLWGWHAPRAYVLALESTAWHRVEHACFLITAVLFWFPVVRPYPFRPKWTTWLLLPYLILAGVQGTALSGILTFADDVLYSHYESMPSLFGISARVDQAMAGAIMWVPMSIALLIALVWMVGQQFNGTPQRHVPVPRRRITEELPTGLASDLGASEMRPEAVGKRALAASSPASRLRIQPHFLNPLVKSVAVRNSLGALVLLLTIMVVVDGFWGPQVAPLNLAGVLPWIHWRGLLVIALVLGGNFFCMVCPFTFLSRLFSGSRATRSTPARKLWRWPNRLKNKWLAVGLLMVFFWAYEFYALWDRPWATAMIAVLFFAFTFILNRLFVDAPFCKFVCPIGQFNFVHSMFSPTTVAAVSSSTCAQCSTRDCIVGTPMQAGCQLDLFQPKKLGNMDCTFCFDCSDACPHQNISLIQITRGEDLSNDPSRSGIGRFSERFDIAWLIIVLFMAALVNAAWMTAPLLNVEDRVVGFIGSRLLVVLAGMVVALVLLPAALFWVLSQCDLRWIQREATVPLNTAKRYLSRRAPALIPLGLAMWLAHYIFHLVTTWDSAGMAFRRALAQLGGNHFDVVPIACACCKADGVAWLLPLEFCFLAFGFCGSFAILFQVTQRETRNSREFIQSLAMWTLLLGVYYSLCLWVLLQPMQMRGALG